MSSSEFPSILSLLRSCWLLLCLFCSTVVYSSELPWIRLTSNNFSSEIHTHPYILCIATVPWCGESRSIMREVSESLAKDETLHSLIQLRIVYINLDKSLGRFFSRRETFSSYPSFTFFWHSTPLKYKGKLRLQNILTAIDRAVLLNSWDLPLKKLETAIQLERFMESTDKAIILFDFCSYIDKIHKSKHHKVVSKSINVSPISRRDGNHGKTKMSRFAEQCDTFNAPQRLADSHVSQCDTFNAPQRLEDSQELVMDVEKFKTVLQIGQNAVQDDTEVSPNLITRDNKPGMLLEDITKDSNEFVSDHITLTLGDNENDVWHDTVRCESETDLLTASSQSFLFGIKKPGEEDSHKRSWSMDSIKSGVLAQVEGCNRTQYRQFANVHQNLIKIARAYILTPELADFAVIDNKRLLSTLGIERMENHTWFLMQWIADWHKLPQMYYESATLDFFLFSPKQLVSELTRESDTPPNFCNNTFSVVLFIDRVSPLPDVRNKSWEALMALRNFARDYVGQGSFEEKASTSMDSQVEPRPASEGLSDLVKSVIETQRPKDNVASLNSLFQRNTLILSRDLPITVSKNLPSKDSAKNSDQHIMFKLLMESDEELQLDAGLSKRELETLEFSELLLSEDNHPIYRAQGGKLVGVVDADSVSSSLVGFGSLLSSNVESVEGLKSATKSEIHKRPPVEVIDELLISKANHGSSVSFYFADGEDQWKDMIQPVLPYPSLVVLDCLRGGMFVFPSLKQSIDYVSLRAFFDQLAKKKLQKVYLSEVAPRKPRKQVQAPFVNRDFHEVDGLPRITAKKLIQLLAEREIVGHCSVPLLDSTEGMHQFWKRAALVLFTSPSCGFCKRMELVFREVHRLLTSDLDRSIKKDLLLQNGSEFDMDDQNADMIGGDYVGTKELGFRQKLPRLFQTDCTVNDCSCFFESINQEELYPSVILYPAQNKNLPIVFGGQATVKELLRFIAIEGEAATGVLYFLQGGSQIKRSNMTIHSQTRGCHLPRSSQSIFIESSSSSSSSSSSRHAYHFTADTTERPSSLTKVGDDQDQKDLKPIIYPTVGSVLLATSQLSKVSKAFESTKILIVKADGQEGFQGLILNKPLAWNRVQGLDSEVEPLVNKTVLCYGGPVILQGEPFLSLSRLNDVEGFTEVVPGISVGASSVTMHVLQAIKEARLDAADFWFFLGHAIWGWQQLVNEIEQHWWNLTSYEEGTSQLPIQEWLEGSPIGVSDLLRRSMQG